jgi:hypothetical protein
MSALREVQQGFARALLDAPFAEVFGESIRAHGLTGPRRIQVYRNNLMAVRTVALAAVYPVIHALVGEDWFAHAAGRFARTTASDSGDIHHYGAGFGAFLETLPGAGELPYLGDVARLEWLYHSVFHRRRAPVLDIAAFASVPASRYDRLCFRLQTAAQLFASPYPVLQIWQANREGGDPGRTIRLDDGATRVLVRRDSEGVVFEPLGEGEYALLEGFAAGATLTEAYERTRRVEPDFDLGAALIRHVRNANLTGAYLTGDASPDSTPTGG